MSEEEKNQVSPEGEESPKDGEKAKTPWQVKKEGWYDKIPLTLKQLDIIIGVCLTLLALTFIAICLDAMGIYNLFG